MPQAISGRNFSIENGKITLFANPGWMVGNMWRYGNEFGTVETEPQPILGDILQVLEFNSASGQEHEVAQVVVSSRYAVFLYLEGVLTDQHFLQVTEYQSIPLLWVINDQPHEIISIPSVTFGKFTRPLLIVDEDELRENILTIDQY